jgi:carbon starvation protein
LFTIASGMVAAMVMGILLRTGVMKVTGVSILGVLGLFAAVAAGKYLPASWNDALLWEAKDLAWAIMIYGFAASVLPVWLLLAPRDYLSTFMKLGTVAVLGVFIVIAMPPLQMPAVTPFIDGSGFVVPGPVFPFVCITIACGAVSGFHALISSGTTPKLLAMVTEMLVALMAIIAAAALPPGQYFAINSPINPRDPVAVEQQIAKINSYGPAYQVTKAEMDALAHKLQEPTIIGRTGGAPTFAVGMAAMFAKVIPGNTALSLWYHFAIMFEALFILTTLDAGTRVGRFILQDLLGNVWKPLGDTSNWLGNVTATGLLVAAWGYFLYQGAIDPEGIAKSLWPIFGISNQLLAVIAFCLGTTLLIKAGKVRYCWTTVIPLAFLATVTFTAGIQKIFSAKAAGFLPAVRKLEAQLAAGVPAEKLKSVETALFNARLDIVGCAWEWWRILSGAKKASLREAPYVRLGDPALSEM